MTAPYREMTSNVAWNSRVQAWEGVAALPPFQQFARRVIAEAHVAPSDVVLDVGAGTGLLALEIARRVESVVAVDSSAPMLARLEQHAKTHRLTNVAVLESDLRDLPLPDEYASHVESSYAFHHLDTSGKELALAEARRVLRPVNRGPSRQARSAGTGLADLSSQPPGRVRHTSRSGSTVLAWVQLGHSPHGTLRRTRGRLVQADGAEHADVLTGWRPGVVDYLEPCDGEPKGVDIEEFAAHRRSLGQRAIIHWEAP